MKKIVKTGMVALSLAGLISLANAATPGLYVGGGLGYTNLNTSQLTNAIKSQVSVVGGSVSTSNDHLGGRLFVGYTFNPYFGIEAGLAHYSTVTYKIAILNQVAKPSIRTNAIDLVGKAFLPISNSGFNVYALGGVAYIKQTTTSDAVLQTRSNTNSAFRPKVGLGASYDINPTVTASFEVSRIIGKGNLATNRNAIADANMATLNLAYNFG